MMLAVLNRKPVSADNTVTVYEYLLLDRGGD
jgi:hypothetical protein